MYSIVYCTLVGMNKIEDVIFCATFKAAKCPVQCKRNSPSIVKLHNRIETDMLHVLARAKSIRELKSDDSAKLLLHL
jgi:hypothetical protein